VNGGNNQQARVGLTVPIAPSALVRDQFLNPVSGATVTFSATAGGGSVTGATPTTLASGVATVGSWTLQATGTESAGGLLPNTLNAAVAGGGSVNFSGSAFYSWAVHVAPILSTGGPCQACHSVVFTQVNTVGVNATLGACAGQQRIVANNELGGVLYRKAANAAPCGGVMPPSTTGLSAAQLKIVRAWIRNAAQNN
jgi:hypothetical protein